MKAKMLISLVILAALTVLPLGSDVKNKGTMAGEESGPGKSMIQKCTGCGKSIQYKHISGENWEILQVDVK